MAEPSTHATWWLCAFFLYLICSLGVNLGEAVNFAAPDWLRFGAAALARLRHFRQPCVVSQEELLLRVAIQQAGPAVTAALAHVPGKAGDAAAAAGKPAEGAVVASSPLVCYHLGRELERVVEEQWVLRAKLWSEGGQALRAVALHFCRHLLPGDLFQQLCWVVVAGCMLHAHGVDAVARLAACHLSSYILQLVSVWCCCCCGVSGLRRSRRTKLRVGFQEGEQDDSECAICHIYMHLSAGMLRLSVSTLCVAVGCSWSHARVQLLRLPVQFVGWLCTAGLIKWPRFMP